MTTEAPMKQAVYRGGRPIGDALRQMVQDGRSVVRGERVRWQENRMFFRGEQWLAVNHSTSTLTRLPLDPQRLQHDVVNRLRQYVEGRVNMLTREKPPYEVEPEDRDQDSMDAARQAGRLLEAMWGTEGWDIQARTHELALAGDIDGCVALYVNWDPTLGRDARVPLMDAPNQNPDGGPGDGGQVPLDREGFEAAKFADPEQTRWRMSPAPRPLGDVCWRVVRMGALAVDPFATNDPRAARWVIESRVRPKDEIRERYGKTVEELVDQHRRNMGLGTSETVHPESVVAEDEDVTDRRPAPRSDQVIVHCAYIRAGKVAGWPDGGYVEWVDQAPGEPLRVEPWPDDLPYFFYCPKPDGQNFIRSRGTVDDLKPLQRRLNRVVAMLGKWMDRVGNPPIVADQGSLASKTIYSEEGIVWTYPGMDRPGYLQTPPEPTAVLSAWLGWIDVQMAEIANLPAAARGQSSPGVDAASHFQAQAQQAELALSGPESQLRRAIEWGCSRSLKLVGRYYVLPRLVATPGADDSEEIRAFRGAALRGSHRMRVKGSMLPRSRAAEIQMIMGFAPVLGADIKPWVAQLVQGDLREFFKAEEAHRLRARRENRRIASLALADTARLVYANFMEDLEKYRAAVQAAAPLAQPLGMSPIEYLATQRGLREPRLSDMLRLAGVDVPVVEEFDRDEQHITEHDAWRVSDGFEKAGPLERQVAREHVAAHQERIAQRAAALSSMTRPMMPAGSAPAEKGTPSPPKQPGGGGPAPMAPRSM